jgi:VIT1/CCC1 family predicted Fe2+/Mn2+ transporter
VKLLKEVSLKQKNEMTDQLLPVVYMIGVLLLVLPAFLQSNSKLKQFLTNLTIWIIVVLMILTIIYIFKNKY